MNSGNYEFFTSNGEHPISGKDLKQVSEYIRLNYVCNNN